LYLFELQKLLVIGAYVLLHNNFVNILMINGVLFSKVDVFGCSRLEEVIDLIRITLHKLGFLQVIGYVIITLEIK